MKFVEIIPQLGTGGAERFVIDLSNELVKHNEVVLISLYQINKNSLFVKDLSSNVKLLTLNKKRGLDFFLLIKLFLLVKTLKSEVVHTHLRSISYCLPLFLFYRNIKYVHTIHNDAKMEAGGFIGRMIRKFLFKYKFVHPITISEESTMSFKKFYKSSSHLIYNGRPWYSSLSKNTASSIFQELDSHRCYSDSKIIINVARLQKQKNQVNLAKAIDHLNKKGLKVELFVIGSFNDSKVYTDINEINSPYVHLLGTRSNIRDYMSCVDAFCLSSLYEGMPITLIECFSVGCIPICTPVGGVNNMIIDGRNGLLSKGCSQADIEDLLIRFLDLSDIQIKFMKDNSLKSFQKYNIEECAKRYINFVEKL